MIKLVEKDRCTGCGACAFVCSKKCISMVEDERHMLLPQIDYPNCVECERCVKICPILSPVGQHEPLKAYAAWSAEEEERRTSASGGIAAEIYKYALSEGCNIAGAVQKDDFSVSLKLSKDANDIKAFKNSKYVFSSAVDLYGQLKESLKRGERCVVICLPCQVAAIRKIFRDSPNIILVDVVCHGTTPVSYLCQHNSMLEKQCGEVAKHMFFRDPDKDTHTFTFSLYNKDNICFYAKRPAESDAYQIGYHRMISYRENCYHCPFACSKRISDITISDYKGIGKFAPCSFSNHKVSSVLVNTPVGEIILNNLIQKRKITAKLRPTHEPIQGDPQLRHPSIKNKYRLMFENNIVRYNGDYEKSINPVLKVYNRDKLIKKLKGMPRRVARKALIVIGLKK